VSIMTTTSSAWRDQLLGIWKLLSVDLINDEGQPIAQPMGPNPLGRLVFCPESYASVLLTNPDLGREAFKDGVEWRQATDTAIATVARVATSYSGPFYFSTDAGTPTLITKGRGITGSKLDWNRSSEGIQPSGRGRQKDSCLGVG
jgi:hypothetical protein